MTRLKISEAAAQAGVSAKAVRYYELLGLVTPGRLANGYCVYSDHDVRLMQDVRSLPNWGSRRMVAARFWSA